MNRYIAEILFSTEDNITEICIKPDASYDVLKSKSISNQSIIS